MIITAVEVECSSVSQVFLLVLALRKNKVTCLKLTEKDMFRLSFVPGFTQIIASQFSRII